MTPRIETVAIDSLMLRLFDQIDEANMPWLMAAAERLHAAFGAQLIDLVPSYTTLMLHYDCLELSEAQALERVQLGGAFPWCYGAGHSTFESSRCSTYVCARHGVTLALCLFAR